MDKDRKARAVVRGSLTKLFLKINDLFICERIDVMEITNTWELIQRKFDQLEILDRNIFQGMLDADASEKDLGIESDSCDVYTEKFLKIKTRVNQTLEKEVKGDTSASTHENKINKRKFKLPHIQFVQYSGDIRQWLTFWGQFRKIHDDSLIPNEDKVQYLILATEPGSKARELVESFPAVGDSYSKIIEGLEKRFGREDLLVEVYIRDLLGIVLQRALPVSSLYDKLECHLRALETLGVTTDKCASMLLPMVESCLPEELFKVWQRSAIALSVGQYHRSTSKDRLEKLMEFLRTEVEGEQKIALVRDFGQIAVDVSSSEDKGGVAARRAGAISTTDNVPSASNLFTASKGSEECVFCRGKHKSSKCVKAQSMSIKDKKQALERGKCCYACFGLRHTAKFCRNRPVCAVCNKRHSTLLCEKAQAKRETRENSNQGTGSNIKCDEVLANISRSPRIQLQTLLVKIRGNGVEKLARAVIDSGSQRSYLLKSTSLAMNYKVCRKEKIQHSLFGGVKSGTVSHNVFRLYLSSIEDEYSCNFEVLDQEVICGNIEPIQKGPWLEELRANGIVLHDKIESPIEILIGADVCGKLMKGGFRSLTSGLTAVETKLGWTLMGRMPPLSGSNSRSSAMVVTSMMTKDVTISDLWELDSLGIKDPSEQKTKMELHEAAYKHFLDTVKVNSEGRYEVHLPWLEGHPPLSDNYVLASKCLGTTIRKLYLNGIYDDYQQVFTEWLEEGVIEEVPPDEMAVTSHYLPHRAVVKGSSLTTKIRPVFNASAKEKNSASLNSCLEIGLNLIELIPSILRRFRSKRIGVVADIRRAFLQISLNRKDRNYLRFLWEKKDGTKVVYRHCRVVFGVSSSPFLLAAVLRYHLQKIIANCLSGDKKYSVELLQKLADSFYVDNAVTSTQDEKELNQFQREAIAVMKEGAFDLRSWEHTGEVRLNSDPVSHVLGMLWNKSEDTLAINLESFNDFNVDLVSKRVILSGAHRLFDPIGVSCCISLVPKLLLQTLWRSKLNWDEEVDETSKTKFLKWLSSIEILKNLKIPRWLPGTNNEEGWTLHVFCDASKDAYATAAFLRTETEGQILVQLVEARSRVAPLGKNNKRTSIPRLELLAACIGSRLYKSIVQDTKQIFGKTIFWTDSTTVLAWIGRKKECWNVFVSNRTREIRSLTLNEIWKFVPGLLNPADLPSRGCTPEKFLEVKWWEGPKWLREPSHCWPSQEFDFNEDEIKEEKKKSVVSLLNSSNEDWYYKYFSKFSQIVRLVAWVHRFIRNCRNPKEDRVLENLRAEEIISAEKKVIKLVQKDCFSGIHDASLSSLQPFIDEEGMIRVKTQISNRKDVRDFCYPVVLKNHTHPVVWRLILQFHRNACHAGVQLLTSSIRKKYWILGGRRTIRKVLNSCIPCKRQKVKPVEVRTTPLPEDRVRDAKVFEVIGVDFAGPLFIKSEGGIDRKVWVCLFTCGVYRAVHLELVSSLSTDRFLLAFRRFIRRRGRPSVVYSDNATNFVGAVNALKGLDWEKITEFSSTQEICWKFNPPTASWWGGWWERMIGIVKQLLRRVLGRTSLDYEEMMALLCDVEAVVNSRPISYISENPGDIQPLSPDLFLKEIEEIGTPDLDGIEELDINRRLLYRNHLRDALHQRFRDEYLGQLRWQSKRGCSRNIRKGEIVLVGSENKKRLDWPLALVEEVLPGSDGEVRLVRLKTSSGTQLRPAQRIYPLELETSAAADAEEVVRQNLRRIVKQQDSAPTPPMEGLSAATHKTRSGRTVKPVHRM